jgi:hypothetical protein
MRKLFLLLIIILIRFNGFGQNIKISTDSLLHHLQHVENIYACFDYQTEDSVIENFRVWDNVKDFYFNDSLKHLLINLFNDSIGWAKYTAKNVRRSLETKSENYKRMALEGYLKDKYNKAFADSVLKDDNLFSQYFDSLCIFREEQSFKEDIGKIGYWNVPSRLLDILSYSHFSEIYDKMYYYWKRNGCSRGDFYYDYLLNVDCPEVIAMMETELDNKEYSLPLKKYLDKYKSEAIRLLIKSLDKSDLIDFGLESYEIPFNLIVFGFDQYSWLYLYMCYTEYQRNDIYIKTTDLIEQIRDVHSNYLENNYKTYINLSKEIIRNKQYIVPFLESAYQKCLEEELYWKQNMPYYKSEK